MNPLQEKIIQWFVQRTDAKPKLSEETGRQVEELILDCEKHLDNGRPVLLFNDDKGGDAVSINLGDGFELKWVVTPEGKVINYDDEIPREF